MEQFNPQPTWWAFLLQALFFASYVPISYLGYRWVRAPRKQSRVREELAQLGIKDKRQDLEGKMGGEYGFKHYIWPLFLAWSLIIVTYSATHPYIINLGVWSGALEEMFNTDEFFPNRAIVSGRVLFWGWIGAYIYSFHLTFRRFLSYDLTPNVYIFTANRFTLAFLLGGIVALWLGAYSKWTHVVPPEVNFATTAAALFFVGFFPERGLSWVTATAKKALKQQKGVAKETTLSEIEGLSIWHQGRLQQAGIENVQNLATVHIPTLLISTPFTINQIIDWVDQAILLVHTHERQFKALEQAGLIRASDVLATVDETKATLEEVVEATGLKASELKILFKILQSALNIQLVVSFRWQFSLDEVKVAEAEAIKLSISSAGSYSVPQLPAE